MTTQTYSAMHGLPYKPKHAKKWYHVWRVLGPGGPEEELDVLGREESRDIVKGCWDWEITDTETGEVIS